MQVAGCQREAEALVKDTAPRETFFGAVPSRLGPRGTRLAGSAPAVGCKWQIGLWGFPAHHR